MTTHPEIRPNAIPWPPLIYAITALAALALQTAFPLHISVGEGGRLFGLALGISGVLLDVSAMAVMARADTSILPHHAASRLVTTGPFAWTRNPIYLGNTLLLAGLGFVTPVRWFIPLALAAAFAVDRLAIRREEAHLRARFGDAWDAYACSVPRWIGRAPGRRQ